MSGVQQKFKIFTGNANPGLAEEIAEYLGVDLGAAKVQRFSDGEISININESVRGADVYVVQPTCYPVNDNLMELLIMIDGIRRASARRITAVVPYYGYARQERKSRARDPISAKLVANLIVAAGARRVLTMDLHASAIQGFFDIPVDHLPGGPILAQYFLNKRLSDVVIVSPDIGGVTRARNFAERLGSAIAIIDKRRPAPNVAEITNIIGNVEGKTVIMIDDIIDTAGTITQGAQFLVEQGAKEVYACCTHAVLSGPAVERLNDSVIKEVVVTNTIPLPERKKSPKIKVLSVAPLLGEAIVRIHEDLSVSKLF
ncbi:MAG: ribose-phosphate pyrophosphokinase [Clostridia bacterium]|jgi:ribose-phosphate pyrophosphokinase|nr:ribose-phosphate pyrophosphokinase [Clostridia bacterium]